MGRWMRIDGVGQLGSGQGRTIVVGGLRLAVFNDEGTFHALDDTCPHQGASLGEGTFHAGRVICPWHSWVFDVQTGRCPRGSHEPVQTYPARWTNGTVEVELPDETEISE